MNAPDPGAGLRLSEDLIENSLEWALFLPVMFAVNLVVAAIAWTIVGLAMSR
jgi:hypothetical protein